MASRDPAGELDLARQGVADLHATGDANPAVVEDDGVGHRRVVPDAAARGGRLGDAQLGLCLVGADVALGSLGPVDAALVLVKGIDAAAVGAVGDVVDGRAAPEQGMGIGIAAVVGQWAQPGVDDGAAAAAHHVGP